MLRRITIPLSLLCVALLGACTDQHAAFEPSFDATAFSSVGTSSDGEITVLTRNVYIGANIGAIFLVDFTDPIAVVQAASAIFANVQNTRFTERAVALADEIEEGRPHLIGLQEVARFITIDPASGPTGVLDYLALLNAELLDRGLHYEVVRVQENTEVTLPIAIDFGTGMITEAVNFTDRDVVLARSDVRILDVASGNYQAQVPVAPGLTLKRGWIRVEAELDGQSYNFVNTHLEGQALAQVQAFQLQELLGSVLAGLNGVTILVGDLNSDAEAGPGDPSWTPTYNTLIAQGFLDTWVLEHPRGRERGFTCCHDDDLRNLRPALDERIDFVLVRDDGGSFGRLEIEVDDVEVLGDETDDLTFRSGLWPSDHAGLIAEIEVDDDDDDDGEGGNN